MSEDEGLSEAPVRIVRLRIRGFRSFGTEVAEVDLDAPLTVIKGDNSQGKTSTAEALEFLLTGHSSRRDLVGGAKAEYEGMLANVHLPADDGAVWVEADVRCPDGVVRTVRRTLDSDYTATAECETTVIVDSAPGDLSRLGIPLSERPLAAPVLLQHNLRYVLSTEPSKRAEYFRALLELADLDIVQEMVVRAKARHSALQPLPLVASLARLRDITEGNEAAVKAVGKAAKAQDQLSLAKHLVTVAQALSPSVTASDVDGALAELRVIKAQAEEQVFPIGALMPGPLDVAGISEPGRLGLAAAAYNERLAAVDADVARLTPIFNAVLAHQHFGSLDGPVLCPLCAEGTLTPQRVGQLREQLAATTGVEKATRVLESELQQVVPEIDRIGLAVRSSLPSAQAWDEEKWSQVAAHCLQLRDPPEAGAPPLDAAESTRGSVSRAGEALERLRDIRSLVDNLVGEAVQLVHERRPVEDVITVTFDQIAACIADAHKETGALKVLVDDLHEELGDKLRAAHLPPGVREALDLLERREELHREHKVDAKRKKVKQRIEGVGRQLQAAEQKVLDSRFETMGAEIDKWWRTLRPDELVRFGGVGRRASGRRYVNLTAKLALSSDSEPQVRDAVGVFSDSQLNALGLAAFIARQRLLRSPVVVLDDPLAGYDPDHQDTFAAYTVAALLDEGVQVILLSHNPRLADEVVGRHQHREPLLYRVALPPGLEGTSVTSEDDFVGRKLAEAKSHLTNTTEEGRKAASSALRDATERLAKQIVAAARTANGTPTTVASLDGKMLGDLIPEVIPYAVGADEPGKWNSVKNILNPGSHDDVVASTSSLGVAVGDLRKIRKDHSSRWGGLPR